ncbi:MAG: hypothetical protein U0792_07730 [Gemmataceae bacterium]
MRTGQVADREKKYGRACREASPKIAGQAVYLSSVTDPYQPVERSLMLTGGHPGIAYLSISTRLTVQTRGPARGPRCRCAEAVSKPACEYVDPTDSEYVQQRIPVKHRRSKSGGRLCSFAKRASRLASA